MTVFRHLIIFIIAIVLSGCPAARTKPLAQPEAVAIQGVYTHPASGMTFPTSIGDFERSAVLLKDTRGHYVNARYDLLSMAVSVAVDIDLYPAPHLDTVGLPSAMVGIARENLSQQEFESRRREAMSSRPDAVLVQEREITLPQSNNPFAGKMALFEYEDVFSRQRQLLRSQLYLFCFAGDAWIIKYQFIYPKNADASQEIENFMMNLPWTLKRFKQPASR